MLVTARMSFWTRERFADFKAPMFITISSSRAPILAACNPSKHLAEVNDAPRGNPITVPTLVAVPRVITSLTAPELVEDPHDLLANGIVHSLNLLSADTRLFAAAYLFGHGAVKLFFVAGLWREKLWAFPTALSLLSAFVLYQVYRLAQRPSPGLMLLTVVDLFVIAVIWREYHVRRHRISSA